MRCLVTGGAGFIGSHLIDYLLDRNYKVVCVDSLLLGKISNIEHNLSNKNFKFYILNILDETKMIDIMSENKFDIVFHLAANSDIKKQSIDLDLQNTFLSTFFILKYMRKFGIGKIVFASSSAVYGDSKKLLLESEINNLPISNYGAAKLSAEAYISSFSHNYDIDACIIRFPNVVGYRATHGVLYDLLNKLEKNSNELEVLGNGKQYKPYIFVKNLVEAILFIVDKKLDSLQIFNIGVEDNITVDEIVKIIINESGNHNTIIKYSGGDVGWKGDVPKYKLDMENIRQIGYKCRCFSKDAIILAVREELKHRKAQKK